MGRAQPAQAGRDRARERRLQAAHERRLRLDPDRLAREQRIDQATVDVEVAWEARAAALQAVAAAEEAAAMAVRTLLDVRLTSAEVAELTGLDRKTVQRLRQVSAGPERLPEPAGQ
jgi:hypothetical protein